MGDFKQSLTDSNTEPNSAFLVQLRSKLPEFFSSNDEFDIEKFKDALDNNNVNEIRDSYTLNYVGKEYARLKAGQPTKTVLIPDVKNNVKIENDNSQNIFLTGDNLDVLKHLQNAYTNSVDFIYIDPPYNTGNDGFSYNDKFDLSDDDLQDTLGMSEDEISRLRIIDERSSHSAWLTFMYPRLKIAQQLLKDTGVIFVSIDENEYADLKLLLDDIFGESNYVGDIVRKTRSSANDAGNGFNQQHEFTFVYAKNSNVLKLHGEIKDNTKYKNPDNDAAGAWVITDPSARSGGPNSSFEIVNPKNGHIDTPPAGRYWAFARSTFDSWVESGKVVFRNEVKEKQRGFIVKKYLSELKNDFNTVNSLFGAQNNYMNQVATKYLRDELFDGNDYFTSPKPVNFIKNLVKYGTDKSSLILDFFAGSATTSEAVMQLNAEDGGNRKYILATLDEPSKSAVAKAAGYSTIDQISRERIKRAGIKIKTDNPLTTENLDIGFKHFYVKEIEANTIQKLNEFNPDDNGLLASNTVSEFSGDNFTLLDDITKPDTGATGVDTILQTWMIDDGYLFNTPVEKIRLSQNQVHYIEDGAILYVIDNITQDDIHELLNAIGTLELNVKTIIVFGYSLNFSTMTSLKNNVNSVLDGVKVEVRY